MAVLGSTVDPRLGAVSPAAIQALSQAGAASGQMYANIGGSIAGVIKDFKDNRDDKLMAEALAESFKGDEDPKFSPKEFRAKMKGKKVSNKKIKEFISDTLQETKLQTEISNAQREADRADKRFGLEVEKNEFLEKQETRDFIRLNAELELKRKTLENQRQAMESDVKISQDKRITELARIEREELELEQEQERELKRIGKLNKLTDAQVKYYLSGASRNEADAAESRSIVDQELYPGALNPSSINQLAAEMGVSLDDFNAKSPIEAAQILDLYIKNLGAADPNDPKIEEYVKMLKGYESRAAGQAAFQGQSFNANTDLPYRLAQANADAAALGLDALPPDGNFNNVPQMGFTRDQLLQVDQPIMDFLGNTSKAVGGFIKRQEGTAPYSP
mgnify:CR=1 FL=1|tara:strand:- start:942 stop:2111 length:1170 start_codon:yes stop_codon:yes gene_type:complete